MGRQVWFQLLYHILEVEVMKLDFEAKWNNLFSITFCRHT